MDTKTIKKCQNKYNKGLEGWFNGLVLSLTMEEMRIFFFFLNNQPLIIDKNSGDLSP